MAGCIDSSVECELRNGESLVKERKRLLGQNTNIRKSRSSDSEMDTPQFLPEHMLPAEHEEDQHCSASEMLLHREPSVTVRTHCHGPAASEDTVAKYQLIAISVLCFIFMVAEVIGELSTL